MKNCIINYFKAVILFIKRVHLVFFYYLLRMNKLDPPLPPPNINYNTNMNGTIFDYKKRFFFNAIERELPFLKKIANLTSNSKTLDFGCGLGRIAAAFKASTNDCGYYYGYEPMSKQRLWLKNKFNLEKFKFGGEEILFDKNYIYYQDKYSSVNANNKIVDMKEFELNNLKKLLSDDSKKNILLDLQYSCSVFTHMLPQDLINTFNNFKNFSGNNTVFVNTFFIVDEFARKSLETNKADRILPYFDYGIYLRSQKNPLLCTAYPLDLLKKIYHDAGHKILNINFGSWSGRDNGIIFQDIVISKLNNES